MADGVLFKFVGPKNADGYPQEWLPGIPARDLTDEDLTVLSTEDRAFVRKSALYERVDDKAGAATSKPVDGAKA